MRMGRVSWLTRRRVPPVTHTHALSADQSHSIPDNLMALLGAVRAWHCSGKAARVPVAHWCTAGFGFQARHALMAAVLRARVIRLVHRLTPPCGTARSDRAGGDDLDVLDPFEHHRLWSLVDRNPPMLLSKNDSVGGECRSPTAGDGGIWDMKEQCADDRGHYT